MSSNTIGKGEGMKSDRPTKVVRGIAYYLKDCRGGCGTWLFTKAQRRCPICGCGLVRVDPGREPVVIPLSRKRRRT